jgi:hypothetical protein
VGWLIAALIIRTRGVSNRPGLVLAIAFAVAIALPFFMPVYVAGLVVWDRLILGIGVVIGAAFGGRLYRPQMMAMLFGCALAGILGEVVIRLAAPAPPIFAPVAEQRLIFNQGLHLVDHTPHREALFPKLYPEVLEPRLRPREPEQPLVLHVGDSMVAGSFAGAEDSFSDQLNVIDHKRVHINAGIAATGPDYYLTIATRWSEVFDPTTVILHMFTGNDLSNIGHAFGFCEGLLYTRDGDRLIDNCETPLPVTPFSALSGRRTPCPYLFRILGNVSALSGHSCALLQRGYDLLELRSEDREVWVHAVLAEAKRRFDEAGIELVIAIIPYRLALEDPASGEGSRHMRQVVLDACEDLDLRVLDSWDEMQLVVDEEGSDRWFINNPPGDIHFSREGHRFYAEWLLPQLN